MEEGTKVKGCGIFFHQHDKKKPLHHPGRNFHQPRTRPKEILSPKLTMMASPTPNAGSSAFADFLACLPVGREAVALSSIEGFLRFKDPDGRYSSGSEFALDRFGDFVEEGAWGGAFAEAADFAGAGLLLRRRAALLDSEMRRAAAWTSTAGREGGGTISRLLPRDKLAFFTGVDSLAACSRRRALL